MKAALKLWSVLHLAQIVMSKSVSFSRNILKDWKHTSKQNLQSGPPGHVVPSAFVTVLPHGSRSGLRGHFFLPQVDPGFHVFFSFITSCLYDPL